MKIFNELNNINDLIDKNTGYGGYIDETMLRCLPALKDSDPAADILRDEEQAISAIIDIRRWLIGCISWLPAEVIITSLVCILSRRCRSACHTRESAVPESEMKKIAPDLSTTSLPIQP